MRSKRETLDILDDIRPENQGSCLMVRIDNNGTIKRCNEPFTQLTGKKNEEAINTPFSTFLSKNSEIVDSWMDVLIKMNDDELIPEMELPLQTSQGEDVIISWTNFPLKMPDDDAPSMLNLIGTPVASAEATKKKSSTTKTKKPKTSVKSQKQNSSTRKTENESEPITTKPKKKKVKGTKQKETSTKKEKKKQKKKTKKTKKQTTRTKETSQDTQKQINNTSQLNIKKHFDAHQQKRSSKLQINNTSLLNKIRQITSDDTKEERADTENRIQSVLHKVSNKAKSPSDTSSLLQKAIVRRTTQTLGEIEDKPLKEQIKILQKQNKKLDNEIKKLEKKIETLEIGRKTVKTFLNKNLNFIRDCVSIDKKRAEFTYMMDQMNQRKQKLEHLETDMIFEKKEFKKKIEEFFTWREKLEQLEQEIEKRRQYLEEHETFLNENFDKVLEHELNSSAPYIAETPPINETDEEESTGIVEEDDLFETLTVEAVVLQRGRIKKVNSLFQQLIGYTEKDLVGKHLVDFVGPSGLAGVEQHYVNRLKGVDDISYDTVFLTEQDKEIPVHVKVKTGEFQGQRAEIATFREL